MSYEFRSVQRVKPERPSLSIVIVTHNSERVLGTCLDSIVAAGGPEIVREVVIVDNGSNDRTYQLARSYASSFERMEVIGSQENLGYPRASNIAAGGTEGSFIMFLNPDAFLSGNFLADIVAVLENLDENIAVIQPKIMSTERTIDSAGGMMDMFGHGVHIGKNEIDSGRFGEQREIFYACFACAIVRREAFDSIGELDSAYYLYGEDLDFCWRAWLAGWRTIYLPHLVVYHTGQHATQLVPYTAKYHARKNTLVSVISNYSALLSAYITTMLLILYLGGALRSWIRSNHQDSQAFVRALGWIAKNLKHVGCKRTRTQRSRRYSDRTFFERGFITMKPYGLLLHLRGS